MLKIKSLTFFSIESRLCENGNTILRFSNYTSGGSRDSLLKGWFLFWLCFGTPPFRLKSPILRRGSDDGRVVADWSTCSSRQVNVQQQTGRHAAVTVWLKCRGRGLWLKCSGRGLWLKCGGGGLCSCHMMLGILATSIYFNHHLRYGVQWEWPHKGVFSWLPTLKG